jgi:3-isopropylmalate/(R)-2-methylmalate dehydratase large subunit
MGKTIAEKILQHASGNGEIKTGELIRIQPGLMPSSNYSVNQTIRAFKRAGMKSLSFKEKIVIINNASPIDSASQSKDTRLLQKFIKDFDIQHYFELGRSGIPSKVISENGFIAPGVVLISAEPSYAELGALSAYVIQNSPNEIALSWATGEQWVTVPESIRINMSGKLGEWITGIDLALYVLKHLKKPEKEHVVLEIGGEGLSQLPLAERLNFARTMVDFAYNAVIFEADNEVIEYLADRTEEGGNFFYPDEDAQYMDTFSLTLDNVPLMAALSKDGDELIISPLAEIDNFPVQKVFIGGSSSSHFQDFENALTILGYRSLPPMMQAFIIPGSNLILSDLVNNGLVSIFIELGFEIISSSVYRLLRESAGLFTSDVNVLMSSASLFHSARSTSGHSICLVNNMTAVASALTENLSHPKSVAETAIDQYKRESQ